MFVLKMFDAINPHLIHLFFQPLEVVSCHRDLQPQLVENYSYLLNPLNPHDALKHHFTSLKTGFIFLQLGVLE